MKFLVPWFVFAVLLFQPRSSQAQHVFDMGLKGSSGTIPFRLDNGFLILVEGRIGTQSNLRFLLDTGATISILDKKMAEKLKLVEFRPPESFNFGRKIAWQMSNVPGVQFGPIKASSVKMLVGHLAVYSEYARNVDAVIGTDLLKLCNFSIDYDSKKIIFYSCQQDYSQPSGEPLSECLMVEVQVQGHPVRLIVDTGFSGLLLYEERLLKRIPALKTQGIPPA